MAPLGNFLQLPELLLESVSITAREVIGLFDDAVAGDPTAKGAELRVEPLDLGGGQVGELLEPGEA